MDHKAALLQHYTSFEGFWGQYFTNHKALSNGEWQVLCPFHEDRNPSMTVNVRTGMFNCFACNAQGDFIKFYMMKTGKSFMDAVTDMCQEAGINAVPTPRKRQIEITYDYLDANGKPIFQVVRFNPKGFSQRHMENGKWVWNLKGIRRVIYNLPDIIKADKVLLMEGEKDCNKAKEMGYTATTCPMGAGSWLKEYDRYLYGKEVVLMPDNDPVGIKHMLDIGNRLKDKANVKWPC